MTIRQKEAAKALESRVRGAGLVRKVRGVYDNSQGNADSDFPEGSEEYEHAQHDHAIDMVWMLLEGAGLLTAGDDEDVVAMMFSEIS